MPGMDQGVERLLQTHPADLLALAMPGAEYLRQRPAEVAAGPQLLADPLFRMRFRGTEYAEDVKIEARLRPQRPLAHEMRNHAIPHL